MLGCVICLLMTVVLALGVKGSLRFNTILNGVNFVVWIFIFVAGMVYADGKNWTQDGFAPYGASGVRCMSVLLQGHDFSFGVVLWYGQGVQQ